VNQKNLPQNRAGKPKHHQKKNRNKTGLAEWHKVAECLPSKHEALSSNPSAIKKKKKKNQG
jgi:hypothetical protein